jgi:hypothetical protein
VNERGLSVLLDDRPTGKVQLASDNTHLADLRTLQMPRADHALLGENWEGCLPRIRNEKRTRIAEGTRPRLWPHRQERAHYSAMSEVSWRHLSEEQAWQETNKPLAELRIGDHC